MKRLLSVFAVLLVCMMAVFPIAAMADAEAEEEPVEGEIVEIVDEEVPLAAIPMSNVGTQPTVGPEIYTIIGGTLVICASIGMLYKLWQSRREAHRQA